MLITDQGRQIAVSNLGWVDHGSLWRFDAASSRAGHVRLSDAKHLALHDMGRDEFAAVHHFDGSRVEITAHSFASPADVLRRVIVTGWAPKVDDGLAPWPSAISHFVAWLNDRATGAAGYYLISVTGFDAVIATRLETDGVGRVTGRYDGGNCYGAEKARRLRALLGEAAVELYAYGDSRGDREMLAMADHAYYREMPGEGKGG